jgi:hypothetical protein
LACQDPREKANEATGRPHMGMFESRGGVSKTPLAVAASKV